MDLVRIEPSDIEDRLRQEESGTMSLARVRRTDAVRTAAGAVATGGLFLFGTLGIALLITAVDPVSKLAFLAIMLPGMVTVALSIVAASARYFDPSDRRLLELNLEPDAKRFVFGHWEERQALLEEAEGFNAALAAFKRLPSTTGDGEDDVHQAVVLNFNGRRQALQEKADAYVERFRRATVEERERCGRERDAHRPSLPAGASASLQQFHRDVRSLEALERSIDALPETASAGCTVEVSLHVAVQQRRAELEEERNRLIALGLKPKALPQPRAVGKLLPA